MNSLNIKTLLKSGYATVCTLIENQFLFKIGSTIFTTLFPID